MIAHHRIFTVVVCWIVLSGWYAAAQTPPEHVEAYVMIVKAEQAEKAGDLAASLGFYTRASELYRIVARDYPEWQPNLVRGRVIDTVNHIERLRKLPDAAPVADSEAGQRGVAEINAQWEAERVAWAEERAVFEHAVEDLENERLSLIKTNDHLAVVMAGLEKKLADQTARMEGLTADATHQAVMWNKEREELSAQIAALQMERTQLEDELSEITEALNAVVEIPALKARISKLEEEETGYQNALAALSNRIVEIQSAYDQQRTVEQAGINELVAEKNRLVEQINALNETIDLNEREMKRVREYRRTIKNLEKENKAVSRQIAKLQADLDSSKTDDEKKRLQAQNAVLIEEVQVFRARLEASERKVRDLERQVAPQR